MLTSGGGDERDKGAAVVATRELYRKGRRRYVLATMRTAEGRELERSVDDHGDAVAVLPYDPARRTAILTRQDRAPPLLAGVAAPVLEALAGMIDAGEDAETAARREAEEETGLLLAALEPVATAWASPGVSTERVSLFLAAYGASDRRGAGGGLAAEDEHIEVVELPLAELAARADRGELDDLKTLALVQTLRLRRPELFG